MDSRPLSNWGNVVTVGDRDARYGNIVVVSSGYCGVVPDDMVPHTYIAPGWYWLAILVDKRKCTWGST